MPHAAALLSDFDHEMKSLRRMLERVPAGRWDFRPHERSMTLGGLAGHLARIPGWIDAFLERDAYDLAAGARPGAQPEPPAGKDEMLAMFDASCARARAAIAAASAERLEEPWRLLRGGAVVSLHSRGDAVRRFLIEHGIHHRGQLSVYLRLLDVPVPALYGASADEPG